MGERAYRKSTQVGMFVCQGYHNGSNQTLGSLSYYHFYQDKDGNGWAGSYDVFNELAGIFIFANIYESIYERNGSQTRIEYDYHSYAGNYDLFSGESWKGYTDCGIYANVNAGINAFYDGGSVLSCIYFSFVGTGLVGRILSAILPFYFTIRSIQSSSYLNLHKTKRRFLI